ncbi:hypothetical protein EF096_16465 [Pseudomonas neustonica]|jgi:hypothetical protein|uniref:Uncharacterized protein n=1 Tax=Pseudomonas neustonica TaxID=2487346 RepID=A0ABX9XEB1_9PSED|nr:hypothetical protein EF099_17035 [Pseudomonas sp. SSM44]ROZ81880.1 hypothetical protein EF096_16465 [Pseudomonas neustonica]
MRRGDPAASYKLQAASSTEMPWGWVHLVNVGGEVLSGKNGGAARVGLQLAACGLQLAGEQKR